MQTYISFYPAANTETSGHIEPETIATSITLDETLDRARSEALVSVQIGVLAQSLTAISRRESVTSST
jgi:hypothetical protein